MQLPIAFCHAPCFHTIVIWRELLLVQTCLRLQSEQFVFPNILKSNERLHKLLSQFFPGCLFYFHHNSTYGNAAQITKKYPSTRVCFHLSIHDTPALSSHCPTAIIFVFAELNSSSASCFSFYSICEVLQILS